MHKIQIYYFYSPLFWKCDTALLNSNFNYFEIFQGRFVLSIGKAGGILNLGDIIDQVVKQNIQNGNVNEAATLLKENGKYAEIVQL